MYQLRKFIFILLLFFLSKEGKAQLNVDSLLGTIANIKVAISDLKGDWYSSDSAESKINFKSDNYYVYIEGIRGGVGKYTFMTEKDSVYVRGFSANWPPYDCLLNFIDSNTLEIMFYQYFSEKTMNVIYKRR